MKLFSRTILSLLTVVAVASLQAAPGKLLNVGDAAPVLKVGKWVKGSPVAIKPGQVTVVEFWATWCGPCKKSIPHITELAKKYVGKVQFAGVSVWERGEGTQAKVEAFVKQAGATMDYNVAYDTTDGHMAKKWVEAAGESGIPTSFVIDGKGKIAWIGHPDKVEDAIEAVLTGRDFKELAAERAKSKTPTLNALGVLEGYQTAMNAKDYAKAVKEADKAIAENPKRKTDLQIAKLQALIHVDQVAARKLGEEIVPAELDTMDARMSTLKVGLTFASGEDLTKGSYTYGMTLLQKIANLADLGGQFHINNQAILKVIEATKAKIEKAKE
jgi:thiol-disulfide isomerase/thioredoxin